MDFRKLALAAVAVVVVVWWKGNLFVSMPRMTRAADVIQVGEDGGDHARYSIGSPADFEATNVGYDFNNFGLGGSFLSNLGGRGLLSYMNSASYEQAAAAHCRTGQCMASYLNEAEANGRMGHLLLIPQDEAALKQMKSVRLADGKRFRLSGYNLVFESGSVQGGRFDGKLGNTGYFLVSSIESRND